MNPLPARSAGFARLLAGLVVIGFGLAGSWLAAQTQPPKKVREEEEESAKSPKSPPKVPRIEGEEPTRKSPPKVPVVVGDEPGAKSAPVKPPVDLGGAIDLKQESARAVITPVKEFFKARIIPHDVLVLTNGVRFPIGLLPNREPPTDELEYVELNSTLTAGTTKRVSTKDIGKLIFFGDFTLAHVDGWLKREIEKLPRFDQLEAAARGLTATIRFHEAAREQAKRVGKSWDLTLARLRSRLRSEEH